MATARPQLDEALDAIEEAILPNLSLLLDGALDAAALARPGADAEAHAAELRRIASQIGQLTNLLVSVRPVQPAAAEELRIPA